MTRAATGAAHWWGLGIAVVLLVVGVWLARELTAASKMQDCVMSGRTNCADIEAPAN